MKPKAPTKRTPPKKKQKSEVQILDLARKFKKWALEGMDDPKSRRLTAAKFFVIRSIGRTTLMDWRNKYPCFEEDYLLGMWAIGIKREEGMMRKELAEKSTSFQLHNYLPDWKESQVYHDERERQTGSILLERFKGELFALNKFGERSDESSTTNGDKKSSE